MHRKTKLVAPAKLDFQPISRRQGIMADQAVFIGWNVEKSCCASQMENLA
ncbi:hypothetical protein SFHH103_psfHH103d_365 (plasmid) [Sinorhizobium fredii HH103]|nr:hypothetical protein SFHH103_psfHH103d_365 [Sinorhizobium fredii HH103]